MKRWEFLYVLAGASVIVLADYPWGDFQDHPHWANVGLIPFASSPLKAIDVANNFILGIPLGIAAGISFRRPVASALLICGSSAIVGEWLQVYSHTRFPSVTDLVCNLAGAAAAAYGVARFRPRYNLRS